MYYYVFTVMMILLACFSHSFQLARSKGGEALLLGTVLRRPLQSTCGERGDLGALMMSGKGVMDRSLFLQGQVTHGYGRGSKKLGVPTANLPHYDKQLQENDVTRGVYYGWAKVYGREGAEVPCVANIGKSPTFEGQENPVNIVEVHVIDPITEDFYGSFIRVALVGFLRPECKFDSFDALVTQINQDVQDASSACASADASLMEKVREFLSSNFEMDSIKVREKMTMVTPMEDEKLGDTHQQKLKCLFGLV